IQMQGLKSNVTLHGLARESKLEEALNRAHLAINLRYPTMGEASGSQLRIWAHALPSLVSKVGWYASLPPETVAFVRPDQNEVADIQEHLRALVSQPAAFVEKGKRGRIELEVAHAPEAYADSVIKLAREGQKFRARAASLKLADHTARVMSS